MLAGEVSLIPEARLPQPPMRLSFTSADKYYLYREVLAKVWLSEAVPNNWSEAVLLPLFKKGDKRICSNYRGIS